jgi:amino acid transporter
MANPSNSSAAATRKFGTFGGVFIPNVLTILGVIMFLRTGWVVGNAGLRQALIILAIANCITLLTSLSLSAIATNTKVGGGGAYFLISRSLGLEIGGSIGVPLFLAQAISVAFYVIGFTESLQVLWPDLDVRLICTIVMAILFVISWVGADLAIKTQYIIMVALGLSLVSFFLGWTPVPDWHANETPQYQSGQNFWSVFAIFFPAVTGIMSGVSMSGDLKDPSRSIPRGTLWAVGLTFVIYAAEMVWLSLNAGRDELLGDKMVMRRIALLGPLIFVGLWAATLSSALASLLAAPRTLQALGHDRVVPRWLALGHGPQNEPRLALALSWLIALAAIWQGDLDLIAPVITMFFLTTYGTVNLVAGLERWVANPSYRPTFRVHWLPSILGAAGCLFVMFLLNALATLIAIASCFGIYWLLKRRQYQTAWGDVRSGFWFAVTRVGLLKFSSSRMHLRNWRPVMLVLVGNPKSRLPMVDFASHIEARRGLVFLAQVVVGDWQKLLAHQADWQQTLESFIQENRLSAVAKTVLADDLEHGVSTLLQVAGVGPLEPNTVMIGWSDDALQRAVFVRTVHRILELKRNLLVFEEAALPSAQLERRIDVWWRAKENGSLMVTLAHLIQDAPRYRDHTIRVLRIIEDEAGREQTEAAMRLLLSDARINAEVEVFVSDEAPMSVIARISERSAVCFVGMALRALAERENPLASFTWLVAALKGNLFITKSWHDLEL